MSECDELEEVVKEFLVESQEGLDRLDRDLVVLEEDPRSHATLASVFRTIHTIKGTCGFLGFTKLEAVAHVGESLLSRLRDGELVLSQEITTALLAMVDAIREMLASIESERTEGLGDYTALVASLTALQQQAAAAPEPAPAPAPEAAEPPEAVAAAGLPDAVGVPETPDTAETPATSEAPEAPPAPAAVVGAAPCDAAPTPVPAKAPKRSGKKRGKSAAVTQAAERLGTLASTLAAREGGPSVATPAAAERADGGGAVSAARPPALADGTARPLADAVPMATADGESRAHAVSETSIRVDVGLLDKLMNLVGELVLARNQILQCRSTSTDAGFTATAQRLNLITTELQEGVMKTRMQPIGNVWNKFPRVVRDLAHTCGKRVRIDMEGQETDLDKTIIEAIKDPLTHLVRNAVDHGLELPDARIAAGKPAEGRLLLRAFHEGGQVNIEITDDGAGLDVERIRAKALERGVVTPEQVARMGERQLLNLIFLPGFSTARQVTNVSGRGVGMDVVKTNIEKIGGTVDIHSVPGHGATINIKIPLTLAIIPALIVTTRGERFAIPQVSLLELVRLEGEQTRRGIEYIDGKPVYRLRGNLLPLVHLHEELGLEEPPAAEDVVNIVVLQSEGRQFGLVVDAVNDTEEIVVKPLGTQLKGVAAFAGATIMGDGRVALILDVLGLARRAGLISEVRERNLGECATDAARTAGERRELLLVAVGERGRLAIPLSLVARLEELPRSAIESANGRSVVQYRGEIMPLIDLASVLEGAVGRASTVRDPVPVVVYAAEGRSVGLIVEEIIDITDEPTGTARAAAGAALLGSAVIQGRVSDLVDVAEVVRRSEPVPDEPLDAAMGA